MAEPELVYCEPKDFANDDEPPPSPPPMRRENISSSLVEINALQGMPYQQLSLRNVVKLVINSKRVA